VKDLIAVALVVLGFAALVTAHVTIVFGLLRRAPRWRAPLALVIAPLAPWWAWRERMRVRAWLWSIALVVYAAAMVLAP
jgi:hypothetical protein